MDIPSDQWVDHAQIEIPPAIAGYIAKLIGPPSEKQLDHIERHIAQFHGLHAYAWRDGEPWHIKSWSLSPAEREPNVAENVVPHSVFTDPPQKAAWTVGFDFDLRFVGGVALLQKTH